jgi:hypothetical protein
MMDIHPTTTPMEIQRQYNTGVCPTKRTKFKSIPNMVPPRICTDFSIKARKTDCVNCLKNIGNQRQNIEEKENRKRAIHELF